MLIKSLTKKGTKIEIREGVKCDGGKNYCVFSERQGSKGQLIKHMEVCSTLSEAEAWVKHGL